MSTKKKLARTPKRRKPLPAFPPPAPERVIVDARDLLRIGDDSAKLCSAITTLLMGSKVVR
jgi:hypothetical protein